jgi:hypothetical protein
MKFTKKNQVLVGKLKLKLEELKKEIKHLNSLINKLEKRL